jgi:hypothetical protein
VLDEAQPPSGTACDDALRFRWIPIPARGDRVGGALVTGDNTTVIRNAHQEADMSKVYRDTRLSGSADMT